MLFIPWIQRAQLLYLLTGLLILIFQKECLANTLLLSVSCTDLMVIPDVLPSTVGISRFTKIVFPMIYLTPHVMGAVVGLLLSDAWLTFSSPRSKNVRLGFKQGIIHFQYFLRVFSMLSHYCSSFPHTTFHTLKGVKHSRPRGRGPSVS
jgi:hypothetical protein